MKRKTIISFALACSIFGTASTSFAASNTFSYKIEDGDTFWKLSQKFDVPYSEVIAVNPDVDPYNLYQGLEVNIPGTNSESQTYTVVSGDTFWIIGNKLNIPYQEIIDANPEVDPKNIYPGLQLVIPKPATSSYVIQKGDTFWTISQKHGIPYQELLDANPDKDPLNLYPGLVIEIPSKGDQPVEQSEPVAETKPTYLADGFFPLKEGTYTPFTDSYGDGRSYNPDGTLTRKHEGIDIMAPKGTPVYSVYDGVVTQKGWNTYGGWRLTIKTPDGKTAFYYAHLSKYASGIEDGGHISKGQLIGYIGSTGYGPEGTSGKFVNHLHLGMYDVINDYTAKNPYELLKYWE